jgi:hypothetical protein
VEIAMEHPRRRRPQTQDHQPDLFAASAPSTRRGAPGWSTLPHQTRSAVTGLVTRLLIEHAGGETRKQRSDADEL